MHDLSLTKHQKKNASGYKGACDSTVPRKIKSNNNKLTSLKGGEFGNIKCMDGNYSSSK